MAIPGIKGLMKQKTMPVMAPMPGSTQAPPPFAPAGTGGLLKKKFGAPRPSMSTEVQRSGLAKRLTGK